jgi:hypothetical protein
MVRNQVAAEPSSKRVSAGKPAKTVHVHTDRLELLNSSQDPTELEQGADSPLTNHKAPENARTCNSRRQNGSFGTGLMPWDETQAKAIPCEQSSPLLHLRIVHELIRPGWQQECFVPHFLPHLHHVYTTTQKRRSEVFSPADR